MDDRKWAGFKRFMDCFAADDEFRAAASSSPSAAAAAAGIMLDEPQGALEAVRGIFFREETASSAAMHYLRAAAERRKTQMDHLSSLMSPRSYASDKLFSYEALTLSRCRTECRLLRENTQVIFFPMAVELSGGCSVQCPFCGFSAPKHTGDFRYTPENAALFRDVIQAAYERFGPITGACPLYFATEPFDNPDYERFMLDVRAITGTFPQTTTAVAEKDPERLHAWIARLGLTALRETAALRISIRTRAQFRKISALYSPEETADVELVANNPESVHSLSRSGRAAAYSGGRRALDYSICCVSGVKVSMTEKTVAFIQPELPGAEYPLGYGVLAERSFRNGTEFAVILDDFLRSYVHDRLPRDTSLRFNPSIRIKEEDPSWLFMGDRCGYRIGKNPLTSSVMESIRDLGTFDGGALRFHPDERTLERLYDAFDQLFTRGYVRINYRN
ncbi:MAG: hypothetical protein IKI84_14800 [Clostridia bacterium]|nr:hypothetical protein [Clostridia bacterium]